MSQSNNDNNNSSSSSSSSSNNAQDVNTDSLRYVRYDPARENEYVPAMRQLISKDLSEPYSIYVYRYFLYQWGDLCFMAMDKDDGDDDDDGEQKDKLVGVVVSKLERHRGGPLRGYIAMLAVREEYRGRGIATKLVRMAIDAMIERDADEIALETEVTNTAAMKLYERLGFLRSKRLHRYYLNGNSAYRFVLYLKEGVASMAPGDYDHPIPVTMGSTEGEQQPVTAAAGVEQGYPEGQQQQSLSVDVDGHEDEVEQMYQ